MREVVCHNALRMGALIVVLLAPSVLLKAQNVGVIDSSAVSDSLSAIERARRYLQLREFTAAFAAAEEAASEAGLRPSSTNLVLPDSFSLDTVATVLLYRGLSEELQREFPEAAADYRVFLKLEPDSYRARELRKRLPYVEAQAVRTTARRYRDDHQIAPPEAFAHGARFSIGVFPLYNESSLLAMSQLAFGLTGVLKNVLSLLNDFSDRPLPSVPYSHIRWVLDEILPQEIYAEPDSMPVSQLTRILDTDYLVLGKMNEIVGSLTANLLIGRAASEQSVALPELQSSYSQTGLQKLQLDLAMSLADSIQTMSGFNYVPSREAYEDSLKHYLITDVDQFIDYGYAMEQLLIGDATEGRVLLLDSDLPVAKRDVVEAAALFAGESPPADNLLQLTSTEDQLAVAAKQAYQDSVAAAKAAADTMKVQANVVQNVARPVKRSRRTAREVIVVSATAEQVLGPAGVGMPRMDLFNTPEFPTVDPRAGKSGTLDPTRQRSGIPVRIEIPVPRATSSTTSSQK